MIDVEALSPRDANAQRARTAGNDLKSKASAAAQLKANKEKEHPPPPPPHVTEPPSSDRRDGAVYQVGKLLGKGGFAVCYEGQMAGIKKKFALKIVKCKMPAKMEQKFQTELQIHSKMKHANIVQFFRAFTFESCTYLVLELCPNGSLMDMVKRRKGVTEAEVRFYTVQIAGAIKYMHAKGIIHRDLKMGNIFLDKDMNAKIGDFGLAALHVTGKDMQTIRRTTLCGTPNYIAPEILEKGKKGHDHMVDIWSLGIIMFAMLASKPPFQSSTTDEIYRRAKERDYEWPAQETKYISPEAKDVVAIMLQDADRRPEADDIVQHPFFTTGYMPTVSEVTPRLREVRPDADVFYQYPMSSRLQIQSRQNLKEACRAANVGPYAEDNSHCKPVWREMASEEKAGQTPIIPLSEGIVYRPFEDWQRHHQLQRSFSAQASTTLVDDARSQLTMRSDDLMSTSSLMTTKPLGSLMRAPPQSFAAQQRAQNRPAIAKQVQADEPPTYTQATLSVRPTRGTRRELPPLTGMSVESREQTLGTKRAPRTQLPGSRTERKVTPVEKDLVSRMKELQVSEQAPEPVIASSGPSLFGPHERAQIMPGSNPDVVLDGLRKLQTELERALNARSMALISTKDKTPAVPQLVVKWVDYTNKFGLGYILNDGSVGCVLRSLPSAEDSSSGMLPPACMLVRDAERHISRRSDASYADRHQLVPMSGEIQFFENKGEAGLARLVVDAAQYKIRMHSDGSSGRLPSGSDVWDTRKRERLVVWKKFANYMLEHGRELEGQEASSPASASDKYAMPADVVTFYQRWGDVSCWVFSDGHLQFNFPDHTKLVLDASGTWCHLWHLPLDAARSLAASGTMSESALDERSVLSYPTQTLLNFHVTSKTTARATSRRRPEIRPEIQEIPAANDFRRKIEFIKNVVKEWVSHGGIGNCDMSREGRARWGGYRETAKNGGQPMRHVWVTIGARGGDERFSAYVDPAKPGEIGEEIDESKRRAGATSKTAHARPQ